MSAPADCGVVYFARGEHYVAEAAVSAASLRQHMPGLQTAIFSDAEAPAQLFDLRQDLVPGLPMKRQKMQALLRSPFARTVYLDTDTFIGDAFWELFELLERFELAMALSVHWGVTLSWRSGETRESGVPVAFPKVNSGVIAYRRTPAVDQLVQAWDRLYVEWGEGGQDQDPLRVALYASEVRWAPLSAAYNYRLPFPAAIRGGVKIFHGRHPELPALCARINAKQKIRATAPAAARHSVLFFGPTAVDSGPAMKAKPKPQRKPISKPERKSPRGVRRVARKLQRHLGRLASPWLARLFPRHGGPTT